MAERLRTKSMENSLMVELQQGFSLSPVEVKILLVKVLADDVLDALEEYAPRQDRLKPGQLVWYAVNLREQRTQGKKNNNG